MTPAADIQAFKRMSYAEKWRVITEMNLQAREWKRAALRQLHPDWTEQQIDQKVRELFLYGSD